MHQPSLEQLKTLARDKLFNVLFQSTPDLVLRWLDDLPAVALCRNRPHRELQFGALTPVQEFVEQRVLWVDWNPKARCDASAMSCISTRSLPLCLLARRCGRIEALLDFLGPGDLTA